MTSSAWLWAVCCGLVFGMGDAGFASLGSATLALSFLLASGVFLLSLRTRRMRDASLTLLIGVCAFNVGVARFQSAQPVPDPYLEARVGSETVLDGIVFQEPDAREGSLRLSVRVADAASSTQHVAAGVLAIASPYTKVAYGDTVRIRGVLAKPERFDTSLGRQFDYPDYLAVSGITYQLRNAEVEVLAPAAPSPTAAAIALKQWYTRGLEAALVEPQAGLAAGITAGDKRGLGTELSGDFRTVSLTHIIVLSGYNITVVADALMRALSWAPRAIRFGAGGFVAVFFVVMTGGAAASVRAALMALIAMSAQLSGRIYRADRALIVAAAALGLWSPLSVAFDPGFQLSIAATAGLIWLSPLIERRCGWIPERFGLRAVCVSTLSAQIAVLPLILYSSGLFSLVALPANILVLGLIPLAMLFSLIAGTAGILIPALAPVFALPAYLALSYMISVAHGLAHVPGAAVALPAFDIGWVFAAYIALFALVVRASTPNEAAAPEGAAAKGFFEDRA